LGFVLIASCDLKILHPQFLNGEPDEYSLAESLGAGAQAAFETHWSTWYFQLPSR
jgi:hypothetical protein